MTKLVAIPLTEVGGVQFGMKRADVRKIFGDFTEFTKSRFSKNTSDDFGFCHVFYDTADECEAIELFPEAEVTCRNQVVLPSSLATIQTIFPNLVEDEGGFIDKTISVGVTAPSGNVESILFGKPGYYSD